MQHEMVSKGIYPKDSISIAIQSGITEWGISLGAKNMCLNLHLHFISFVILYKLLTLPDLQFISPGDNDNLHTVLW